jgi:hypothetical protein
LLHEKISTPDWNPLHFAVFYKHIEVVKIYLEEIKVNSRFSLMGPASMEESGINSPSREIIDGNIV